MKFKNDSPIRAMELSVRETGFVRLMIVRGYPSDPQVTAYYARGLNAVRSFQRIANKWTARVIQNHTPQRRIVTLELGPFTEQRYKEIMSDINVALDGTLKILEVREEVDG